MISNCSCGKRIVKGLESCVKSGMRVEVWCRGSSWGRGAEVTSSGCLSRGSRGRDCRVLCMIYVQFKDLRIIIGFSLCEKCARDVVRSWGLRGAGKAVCVTDQLLPYSGAVVTDQRPRESQIVH